MTTNQLKSAVEMYRRRWMGCIREVDKKVYIPINPTDKDLFQSMCVACKYCKSDKKIRDLIKCYNDYSVFLDRLRGRENEGNNDDQ